MATTPQLEPLPNRPKPTLEEVKQAVEAFRESVRPYIPADWDLDAELKAEHEAILAGADL